MKAKKQGYIRCVVLDEGSVLIAETFKLCAHTWKQCIGELKKLIKRHHIDNTYASVYLYDSLNDIWLQLGDEQDVLAELSQVTEQPLTVEVVVDGFADEHNVTYTVFLADNEHSYNRRKIAASVQVDYEEN